VAQQKLYNVIKIKPKVLDDGLLVPRSFVENLRKKGRLQDKEFKVIAVPLDIRDYRLYSPKRYTLPTIVYLFNNHLTVVGVDLKYVMSYSFLVKGIIDALFEISGSDIEEVNKDINKLFRMLEERRMELASPSSLLDNMVIANMSIKDYLDFRQIRSFDEKVSIVAALESSTGVILKDRYDLAVKLNKPIKLSPDKNFGKEFERIMGKDREADFGELKEVLSQKIAQEKREAALGKSKKRINTAAENAELIEMDSSDPGRIPLPSNLS
jgi:hypothetical protein